MSIEKGSNKRKMMEKFEDDPEELQIKDPKIYRRCLAIKVNNEFRSLQLPLMNRPWQVVIEHLLRTEPDSRTIFWIYGSEGNEGKTTWAKKKVQEGWYYSRGGKGMDIKYGYLEHLGSCVFDLPRQSEDVIQYRVLEEIKDRMISSEKYEPVNIHSKDNVHVVVCANFKPCMVDEYSQDGKILKRKMLSSDRLCLINIDESEIETGSEIIKFERYISNIEDEEQCTSSRSTSGTHASDTLDERCRINPDNLEESDENVPETQPMEEPLSNSMTPQLVEEVIKNAQTSGAANRIRRKYNKDCNFIV